MLLAVSERVYIGIYPEKSRRFWIDSAVGPMVSIIDRMLQWIRASYVLDPALSGTSTGTIDDKRKVHPSETCCAEVNQLL